MTPEPYSSLWPNRRVGARFCYGCPALLALIRQPSGVVHEHRVDPCTGAVAERHVCRPLLSDNACQVAS